VPSPDEPHPGGPAVALRETCRLVGARVPLWPYHRTRLASGGCGPKTLDAAQQAMEEAAAEWAGPVSSRLRLTVVVETSGAAHAVVQRRLSSLDVPGGPRAVPVEVDEGPPLAQGAAKPADRRWWDDAQRRARAAGGDQALIVRDGLVLDGGTASVWAVRVGVVLTPPAPQAVAGVARAFLLAALADAGVPTRVEPLALEDALGADELFCTNAFAGAVALRGRGPGPVTRLAVAAFVRLWGEAEAGAGALQ
jgi:branched-subunit amino acid aminotransferase/4-amino-4-deoxychorismate lyase